MRKVTIIKKIYTFSELSEKVQKKVLSDFSNVYTELDWWDSIREDAEDIGLWITGFDLYKGTVEGELLFDCKTIANNLLKHGAGCDTYKFAKEHLENETTFAAGNVPMGTKFREVFKKTLLKTYLNMLNAELDYVQSEAAVKSFIEGNAYEFLECGSLYTDKRSEEPVTVG